MDVLIRMFSLVYNKLVILDSGLSLLGSLVVTMGTFAGLFACVSVLIVSVFCSSCFDLHVLGPVVMTTQRPLSKGVRSSSYSSSRSICSYSFQGYSCSSGGLVVCFPTGRPHRNVAVAVFAVAALTPEL